MKVTLALLLGMIPVAGAQTQQAPHAMYYRTGAAADVVGHPRAGYALMGGGTDLDEAFRWLCDHADGGDLLVLRASGDDAYNPYIRGLCKLNSVATLVIPDREAALDPSASGRIQKAAAIFISGGDQSKYTRYWRGTPVEAGLRDAVKRGIPIGGTSAGLAVLGEYIYSAENDRPNDDDLKSETALADPFYRQVVVAPDLLGIPILRGIITDTHFDTRHREGRLLVFMARILASGPATEIRSIGVDEKTALLVEPDGSSRVVGMGEVDFFVVQGKPAVCEPGQPLQIGMNAIQEQQVHAGESFDLKTWQGSGRIYAVSVIWTNGQPVIAMTPGPWVHSEANR
ncbi:MAG TPA: cyanophycinase [Silvibacterium sp.]|nr:cyanophycinase [Silvibacterium sp.]